MVILFLIVFVDMISFGIVLPLLPAMGIAYGFSDIEIGIISASFSFAMLFSATILGILSDIVGRRKIIIISLLLMCFSYVLLEFAKSFEAVLLARVVAGIGAGNIGVSFAVASDISSKEKRNLYIGILSAAFGLGFIVGPGLGGLLAGTETESANFFLANLIASVVCFVAFFIAFFFLKETLSKEQRAKLTSIGATTKNVFKKSFETKALVMLFAINALLGGAFAGMETFIIVWNFDFLGWAPKTNGYYLTFYALVVAIVQIVSPFAIKDSNKALFGGLVIFTVSTLGFVFTKNVEVLLTITVINAIGLGIVFPALNSSLSHMGEQSEQGAIFGLSQSLGAVGRSMVPVFLGFIYGIFPELIWVVCAFISLICVYMTKTVIKLNKPVNV